ncbi:MAG: hypothetical protein ACD_54C00177G0001 [uncultured bacterium]|nr:MAG: hypothetical protein ACD_54C00177G0001 [uncultured bacterium]
MPPHFFTGKPCKRGHSSVRQRSDGGCFECDWERVRAYQKTPAYRDYSRDYSRDYQKTLGQRTYKRAYDAHRRALKLKATPSWLTDADKAAMRVIYDEAARLTRETGIPHHVDHIVPLKATCPRTKKRNACGLHCPANLQVLPASENLSKLHWFDDWSEEPAQQRVSQAVLRNMPHADAYQSVTPVR